MSKYDSGAKYDFNPFDGGFAYDYITPRILITLSDVHYTSDESKMILASMFIQERGYSTDGVSYDAMIELSDLARSNDNSQIVSFYEVMDELNILDSFITVVATIPTIDLALLDEQIQTFATLFAEENSLNADEITTNVLLELADENKLDELVTALVNAFMYESFATQDETPQKAITDFLVGKIEGMDERYTAFSPFDMYIDFAQSTMPIMPATESTYIDIPGIDGSIVQDTTYKNRLFNFVCGSMRGLSKDQIEVLKKDITLILDSTKNQTRRLTFQETGLSFDVKYSGELATSQSMKGGWVKANIPLESSPYGESTFPTIVQGDGIIVNDGVTDLGVFVSINDGCVNPNFTIGDVEFYWEGTVPVNQKLIIDNEDKTCYLIDELNVQTQALAQLTKGYRFAVVSKGKSAAIQCLNDSTREHITVTYNPKVLWNGGVLGG